MHILVLCALLLVGQFVQASSPYLGEIRMFAGNFAPRNWAFCNGQLLPISENDALFSLIGTIYGGDGVTTFALPDLRGRSPMHFGQGPGLSNRVQGQQGGVEGVTLTTQQMPAHNHGVNAATNNAATQTSPANNFWGRPTLVKPYSTTSDTTMNGNAMGASGGSQPHENMAPYLGINYIIALAGIYPSPS